MAVALGPESKLRGHVAAMRQCPSCRRQEERCPVRVRLLIRRQSSALLTGGSPKQEGGQDAEHLKTHSAHETRQDTKLWNVVTVDLRALSHHTWPPSEDSEEPRVVEMRGTPLCVHTAPEPSVNKGSFFLYRSPQRASVSSICYCKTSKVAAKGHFQKHPSPPSHKDIRLQLRAG